MIHKEKPGCFKIFSTFREARQPQSLDLSPKELREREIALVNECVSQYAWWNSKNMRISVESESSDLQHPEFGETLPLLVIVDNRIIGAIHIVSKLRSDGAPPSRALSPVTYEGVKAIIEKGLKEHPTPTT